jgi:hypothetical protein
MSKKYKCGVNFSTRIHVEKINATVSWSKTKRGRRGEFPPLACPELVEGLDLWLQETGAAFLARVPPNKNAATFSSCLL